MKKLLLVSILVTPTFFLSKAMAQTKPINLSEVFVTEVDGVVCGFVEKWIPGRMLSNGLFLPTQYEIRKLVKRLATLDSGSVKRNALVRKIRSLRRTYKSDFLVCSSIPTLPAGVTATPTVNLSGGIGGGKFKTATPTSTVAATVTGSPVPTTSVTGTPLVGTPTVTPTPTGTATPTLTPTAVPDKEITNYASLEGYSIKANDGTFIGSISTSKFSNTSISNTAGTYGSKFGSLSIFNLSGNYGSTTGERSAFNTTTTTPPVILNGDVTVGYLTLNSNLSGQYVNTCKLVAFLGRSADVTSRCQ